MTTSMKELGIVLEGAELAITCSALNRHSEGGAYAEEQSLPFFVADHVISCLETAIKESLNDKGIELARAITLKIENAIFSAATQSTSNSLIGKRLVGIRPLTDAELAKEGWAPVRPWQVAIGLVFDDGTILYPSIDDEGNGPGSLFGVSPEGIMFRQVPETEGVSS